MTSPDDDRRDRHGRPTRESSSGPPSATSAGRGNARIGALCLALIALASRRVPLLQRTDWRAEWQGELWALQRRGAGAARLIGFTLACWADARRAARGEEGTVTGFIQDVRMAARMLRRSPGFTFIVVMVIGLGVAANTVLFGALHAVLLDRTPYPSADRLVMVDMLLQQRADVPADTMPWSYPKFELAREQLRGVESLAAYTLRTGTFSAGGQPERVAVEYVTPGYFELLGVRPVLGRLFGQEQDEPSGGAVALLGHALWKARFGSDPGVVGRSVTLDGAQLEVIGVIDSQFDGVTGNAQMWLPVAGAATVQGPARLTQVWAHWLYAFGRLAPDVPMEQARAEAAVLGARLTEAFPDPAGDGEHGTALVPFLRARVNPTAQIAVVSASASALLLLLIACGNVGGLLLARGSARGTDMAVRAAIGASRARLTRELLIESMLLAALGGALGLILAFAGQGVVRVALPAALQTLGSRTLQFIDPDTLGMTGSMLGAGIALTGLTGLLFGVVPAYTASRPEFGRNLGGGRGTIGRRRAGIGRGALATAQLALTLVLLAGAGLLAASFRGLSAIDPGYRAQDALLVMFDRGAGTAASETRVFEQHLLERVVAGPGVASAAIAPCAPLQGRCEVVGLRQVDDGPLIDFGQMEGMLAYAVSDDYFDLLEIPINEGRTFEVGDGADGRPVAVVNEAAAAKLFPGQSALGHRVMVTNGMGAQAEIVGVVADVRYGSLEEPAMPGIYFSRRQAPAGYGTLLVRPSTGDPQGLLDGVRATFSALDPDLPVFAVATLAGRRAQATARTRAVLGLLTVFALCGLLLSAVGLYGIVSFMVVRRTGEIGLRVALGAAGGRVTALVMRAPLLLAGVGVIVGLAAELALTRHVETLLFEVRPADIRVLALATIVLLTVALAAAWIPARRALRIEPADALKGE